MKRTVVSISLALMFVLTFVGTGLAGWNAPTVTPVSGDMDFEVVVTDPSRMTGAFLGMNNLMLPKGWVEGEMQFSGKGVTVKGFAGGVAMACFPFDEYVFGWFGNVHRWSGTKWEKLVTSIVPAKESAPTFACANIKSDGVYALIVGLAAPKVKSASEPLALCPVIENIEDLGTTATSTQLHAWVVDGILDGTTVSYIIHSVDPTGAVTAGLTGSGIVSQGQVYFGLIEFISPVYFEIDFIAAGCLDDLWYGEFYPN